MDSPRKPFGLGLLQNDCAQADVRIGAALACCAAGLSVGYYWLNAREGWSRDVTLDIADEVAQRFTQNDEVSHSVLQFVEADRC